MDDSQEKLDFVRASKPRAAEAFAQFGEVSGVGITKSEGQYGLKVNFTALTAPRETLPTEWEGVPVDVEVTGKILKR